MKRRTFILAVVVVGTSIVLSVFFEKNKELKWKKVPFMYPLILSGFCDEETIRNIGKSYRALVPNENSKDKISNLLTNGINKNQLSSTDYSMVADQLELNAEQDFKMERVIILEGWVLSETEARQCAILSLS